MLNRGGVYFPRAGPAVPSKMRKPTPVRNPRYWREGVSFIKTELELGLAFSAIALGARNRETVVRNTANARAAFDTAQRHVSKVLLTAEDSKKIDEGFAQLRANLAGLSAFLGGSAASFVRPDPMGRC